MHAQLLVEGKEGCGVPLTVRLEGGEDVWRRVR